MDQNISSPEESRKQFYEQLKQEDIDEANELSLNNALNLCRRVKLSEDPWMYCFEYDESMADKFGDKPPIRLDFIKNLRDKLRDMVSNPWGITDEELNHCKSALRREARIKKLPSLLGKQQELNFLYQTFSGGLPVIYKKQRNLREEIDNDTTHFEMSLEKGLETLKPFINVKLSANAKFESVKDNVGKMVIAMQKLQRFVELATKDLNKIIRRFEMFQELEENVDKEMFAFLAHFLPTFFIPRSVRRRSK